MLFLTGTLQQPFDNIMSSRVLFLLATAILTAFAFRLTASPAAAG